MPVTRPPVVGSMAPDLPRPVTMSALASAPLGAPLPGPLHSVSCSLPTMAAVIGYEERDPAITGSMAAGYPRFTVHPLVRELTALLATEAAPPDQQLWPVLTPRAAAALAAHLGDAHAGEVAGVSVVHHAAHPELATRARLFLQHHGGLLSSRAAEDALVRLGRRAAAVPEALFPGDAAAEVRRVLRPCFPAAAPADLHLAPSGMGALAAAFQVLSTLQAARGRTVWVQLGWLYLDTIALLAKFTADPARDHQRLVTVRDLAELAAVCAAHGPRLAGLIAETPTNPLLQTPDVPAVAALARRHGARLILDPAIASPFNVDVLAHADVVAFSLTKYAAHTGDVMAGAAVVNPAGPDAAALRAALPRHLDAPYARDLARLAHGIGSAPGVVARINANTPRIVEYLSRHPAVAQVWWALQPATAENYRRIARQPGAVGGVVSFTLHGPLARFYDRVPLPKGPSFGMATTLLCPYVYLAHYDLLPTRGGGDALARAGVPPELLRLSVGAEPAEAIIAALAAGLD